MWDLGSPPPCPTVSWATARMIGPGLAVTGGRWQCVVASNGARVRLEECTLGGRPAQRASHGIIAYGDARVQTRNSDFSYCSTALVTGGRCRAALRDCDVKDCESAFSVLRPGAAGFSIHISGCEFIRCGRVASRQCPLPGASSPGQRGHSVFIG
jgi:hypothetical protein